MTTKPSEPRKRRPPLRRWNQLSRFLEILLYTGHISNGRPMSAFLIAEPGEGKTSLLERFRGNTQVDFYSDLTYRTIISVLKDAARGRRTHLCCTEFQKIIMRRASVANSTLTIMLQAMEEGVFKVGFGPQEHDCMGARLGVLAATTVTSIEKNPTIISELAMDSRAFFIDATSTEKEILEIEERIVSGDDSALKPILIHPPARKVHVEVPEAVGQRVRLWVREMQSAKVRTYGVRTLTRFLHTLRGVALKDGSDVVRRAHEDELYEYRELWLAPPQLDAFEGNGSKNGNGD